MYISSFGKIADPTILFSEIGVILQKHYCAKLYVVISKIIL